MRFMRCRVHTLMNRKIIFTTALIAILGTGTIIQGTAVRDHACLELKSSGRYNDALTCLHDIAIKAEDPVTAEFAVLMTGSLMNIPELRSRGLDLLCKIEKISSPAMTPLIRDRVKIIKSRLLLQSGEIKSARQIIDSMAFTGFMAAGPFSNSSRHDFERSRGPENGFNHDALYRGKRHTVSWFRVEPDRLGTVRVDDLFDDTGNSLFYFHLEFCVPRTGSYRLLLGKTGSTDMWINSTMVFSNRKDHGFSHDQYLIPVHLEKGRHSVLIKTGDSRNGSALCLRVIDTDGNPLLTDHAHGNATLSRARPGRPGLFPSLQALVSKKSMSDRESFLAGYLYHAARINSEDNSEILKYFSPIKSTSPWYSYSRYLLGVSENSVEKKEDYFKSAHASNPGDCESLYEIIKIKLDNGFYYEADPLIRELRAKSGQSMLYLESMIRLFSKKGWDHEAIGASEKLGLTPFPSSGYRSLAGLYMDEGRYASAQKNLEKLYRMDAYNYDLLKDLVECCEKKGSYARAKNLLARGISLFPNTISLRTRLAEIEENTGNVRGALPLLSSGLVLAPWNRDLLKKTGLIYHRTGNRKLAARYLGLALRYDPGNFHLKQYLREITGKTADIRGLVSQEDLGKLIREADTYRHEPAVILLSEQATRVNADASYRRHIRRVIRVNSEETFREFTQQYIIIDPATETVEDLRCYLITGNRRVEIKQRYRKSLSDPESSLYYNLEAVIIPVSALEKGSILDLQYVIRNTGGKEYREYYGDKIFIGGKYRTLMTSIVLNYPGSRNIYSHLNRISRSSIHSEEKAGYRFFRLHVRNSEPLTEEDAMPHESEILPSVCFTSFRNMKEMASWYTSLLKNRTVVSPEMEKSLSAIISPDDSRLEIIRKVYRHVTDEVRYTGFEFGIGTIQPRRTDMTYRTRMGDCKDVSLLLAAMLKECGISAKLALVRTRDRGPADTTAPFIGEFNHALCHVDEKGGFFLDATAKGTGFRELPAGDRDIDALVIDEKGYSLINTGSKIYEKNHETVTNHITISETGDAVIRRTLVKRGETAAQARKSLLNPEDKILRLSEYWNRRFPGCKVSDLDTGEVLPDRPVTYSYTVTVPSFAQVTDSEIIFKAFPVQSGYFHNYTRPAKRRFPLVLGHHWKTDIRIIYRFPRGYRIYRLPDNDRFSTGSYSASYSFEGGEDSISLSSKLRFSTFRIAVKDYSAFRKATRFIHRKENERVILVKNKKRDH